MTRQCWQIFAVEWLSPPHFAVTSLCFNLLRLVSICSLRLLRSLKKKRLVNDRTEVYLSDRWRNALCDHYDVRSLKSGFHMIATIAERFFQRSQ